MSLDSEFYVLVPHSDQVSLLKGQALSAELQWPMVFDLTEVPQGSLILWVDEGPLRLQNLLPPNSKSTQAGPIWVDFMAPELEHRRRYGVGKSQLFTRSLGLHKIKWEERKVLGFGPLRILDATAGMGQDAWIMAWMNPSIEVLAMEKSLPLFKMLKDGVSRAQDLFSQINLSFMYGDSLEFLKSRFSTIGASSDQNFDIIYLDPMFAHLEKSALSRKEMQVFRRLFQESSQDLEKSSRKLLAEACEHAPRVVVKRPRKAPPLLPGLAHHLDGRSIRYDIYLNG